MKRIDGFADSAYLEGQAIEIIGKSRDWLTACRSQTTALQ
jgi:hypothetical protein